MAAAAPGRPPATPGQGGPWRALRSPWRVALLVLLVVAVAAASLPALQGRAPNPTPTRTPRPSDLTARGELQPIARARVRSLAGGVVTSLSVEVGQTVAKEQEIARVRGPDRTEVLTAPLAGVVTGVLANVGDTVVAGRDVATVADLSRLQVETTDVDEFIVADVYPGQEVRIAIDAVEGQLARGYVRTVAPQPQPNATGDLHYPVVIDVAGGTSDLRPGMSVRVYFLRP